MNMVDLSLSSDSSIQNPRTRLSGNLGAPAITLMVIACAAPLSVIAGNTPLSVAFGNGMGTPANFAIASIIMLFFAIALSAMTKHVRNAGAFYSYVGRGLGPTWGMSAAAVSWLMYTVIQSGVYAYFGLQLAQVAGQFGFNAVPWWAYSLLIVMIIGLLGYRHIELSAKVLGITCILEFVVVTVLDVAILIKGGDHGLNISGFTPVVFAQSVPLFAVGMMFCANGFLGFESTAIFRDEVKNPDKTIPRATYAALAIIGVFYTLSAWAMTQGWGDDIYKVAATGSPFTLELAIRYAGSTLADVINTLLIGSLFACVLSLHNVISRYQFTLANAEVLPARLAAVHHKHGSPYYSSIVQTLTAAGMIIAWAVLQLDPNAQVFAWASGISTLGFFIALWLTSLSTVVFFARRGAGDEGIFKAYVAPVISLVTLGILLVLTVLNFGTLTGGSVWVSALLIGVVFLAVVLGGALPILLKASGSARYLSIAKLTEQ